MTGLKYENQGVKLLNEKLLPLFNNFNVMIMMLKKSIITECNDE